MKIILVNLFIIFFSNSIIYAEDESWYEIDGITFRIARKIEATKAYIQDYDLVIIATAHDSIDYSILKKSKCPVVDTRGVIDRPWSGYMRA